MFSLSSSSSSSSSSKPTQTTDRTKAKFYTVLGKEPPRTLSKFSASILSQLGRRKPPPLPDGAPPRFPKEKNLVNSSSGEGHAPHTSRRGSLCNHSSTVKNAALKSARSNASVQNVVKDSKFYQNFLQFCSKEWCGENPRFLKAAIAYKSSDDEDEREKLAFEIMRDFFDEETATHPVSLPGKKLSKLKRLYDSKAERRSGRMFNEAFYEIEKELSQDVFPRYLKSDLYESIFLKSKPRSLDPISACASFDSSNTLSQAIKNRLSPSRCRAISRGWLEKRGGKYSFGGWKRRWCILRLEFLFYFTPQQSMSNAAIKPQGQIAMREVTKVLKTRTADGVPCFALLTEPRRYDFKACSLSDRDSWVANIRKVLEKKK